MPPPPSRRVTTYRPISVPIRSSFGPAGADSAGAALGMGAEGSAAAGTAGASGTKGNENLAEFIRDSTNYSICPARKQITGGFDSRLLYLAAGGGEGEG